MVHFDNFDGFEEDAGGSIFINAILRIFNTLETIEYDIKKML